MTSFTLRALLPAVLLATGACTVGPDYGRPQLTTPPAWVAPRPHGGEDGKLIGWWGRFGDPVLTELQRKAEENSPTLEQAVARIDQARATLSTNRAQGLPSVTGSGSYTTSGASGATTSSVKQYGADASWEIDLFGKVRRNTQAARSRVEARIDDWHDARVSLAAEVADDYVRYRGCEQLVLLYREQAQSQSETTRLNRINANAGFTAPADYELAEASAASVRSTLTDQIAQCDLLVKSLTSLTGLEEDTLREKLAPGSGVLPQPAELDVASIPADLLRQRPDIASSERELAAASAEIGAATAELYPSLSLGGSITAGGVTQWSFGPSISLPLFDGGKARAAIRSAEGAYSLQLATYRGTVRAAVLEVEQALVQLDAVRARDADTARAAQGYQANFAAIERLRQAGSTTAIERESARRNALDAKRTLLDLRMTQIRYWIALYKALGGGWEPTDEIPTQSSTGAQH
ncbi:MAG: efflux transporter outer membrane subunit [Candidatus Andeanibacterium colombiense]|uniref:Efflux transporter outer membrane subunit n=1 Tax=Candidatus Andeanibacterium colombiense TaxID=3121345 RepID=A0AAJ5X612_9SPHN|nr:MAG: efflux transporter outer membrane subunit [Sphingomonadaceae bacterium]